MIESLLVPFIPERFRCDAVYHKWYVGVINPLPCRCVLGVHTPELKGLAKQLAVRDDVMSLLSQFAEQRDSLCHEERMVWGFIINALNVPVDVRLELVKVFVPAIDNWAVCDAFCGNAKWVRSSYDVVWSFILPYFKSVREFEVRFGVVMAMSYFINDDYLKGIFTAVDGIDFSRIVSNYVCARDAGTLSDNVGSVLGPSPYYVRMGVAWLLASALAKFPEATRAYVRESSLPTDVIQLYVRKARESFRTRNISAL